MLRTMLRMKGHRDEHDEVSRRSERMGLGRDVPIGMRVDVQGGTRGEFDVEAMESLVVMAEEAAAFERDALGVSGAGLAGVPAGVVGVGARAPGGWMSGGSMSRGWMPRIAGLAAALALAAGVWQVMKSPGGGSGASGVVADAPGSAMARSAMARSGSASGWASGTSFAHARDIMLGERALDWADPSATRRMTFGGVTRLAILPAADDALAHEERSLILAVFQDDDSPWCECVRVQSGTLCSGQRVDQVSKEDLISAAMDSSCMVGAERVSIFAFTGPASKLPATREEAEALAITLAGLPVECLKSDPCVQHMASACLPTGVAMVSQTLAINDIKTGW